MKSSNAMKFKMIHPMKSYFIMASILSSISLILIILLFVLKAKTNIESTSIYLNSQFLLLKISLLFAVLIISIFVFMKILQNVTITIDDTGITKTSKNLSLFGNYFIPWSEISSVEASTSQKILLIRSRSRLLPYQISLPFWADVEDIKHDRHIKAPITIFAKMKYKVNDSPLFKKINEFLPESKPIQIIENTLLFKNTTDLGARIKTVTFISMFLILFSLIGYTLIGAIVFEYGYYWVAASSFMSVGFFFGLLLMIKELITGNLTKILGSILVSILIGLAFTLIISSSLKFYTKYKGEDLDIKFKLVKSDDKFMYWHAEDYNWENLKIVYDKEFEKNIQIESEIILKVKKGPFKIYLSAFDDFDTAISVYKNKK